MDLVHITYGTLVAILALLQIGDMHSTYVALTQLSWVKEKNPIIQKAIDIFGLKAGLIVPKFLFVYIVWWLGQPTWVHVVAFGILTAFYVYVVSNNYRIVKKHTGSYMGK